MNGKIRSFFAKPVVKPLAALLLMAVAMTFLSDKFATADNIFNVLRQVSVNLCISVGMTMVILTGGIAHSKMLTGTIKEHLEHTVKVVVMPGENEMEALAFGGLRILRGEEAANPAYE